MAFFAFRRQLGFRRRQSVSANHLRCLLLGLMVAILARNTVIGQTESAIQEFKFSPEFSSVAAKWTELKPELPANLSRKKLFERLPKQDVVWLGATTYGAQRSRSVAIAVGLSDDATTLFLDSNRNGIFEDSEVLSDALSNASGEWSVPVNAEFNAPATAASLSAQDPQLPLYQTQQVEFQFEKETSILRMRTAGTMVGLAKYQNKDAIAHYEDRNANGRWFDSEDRIFVDLNHDGKINRLLERLPAQGTKKIRGQLTAILGSERGLSLGFQAITAQGTVAPKINLNQEAAVEELEATLSSPSGMQVVLSGLGQVDVPVGTYFVRELKLVLKYDNRRFSFRFGLDSRNPNIQVNPNETTVFDLLGSLKLNSNKTLVRSAGFSNLIVTPTLKTTSGLYLLNCLAGSGQALTENRLTCTVFAKGRRLLGAGSSGFS